MPFTAIIIIAQLKKIYNRIVEKISNLLFFFKTGLIFNKK